MNNDLIFGKNPIENIIAIELLEDSRQQFRVFFADKTYKDFDHFYYILAPIQYDTSYLRLKGNLHYCYIKIYKQAKQYYMDKKKYRQQQKDFWAPSDPAEAIMLMHGFTFFKGMSPGDLNILSFDIETNGLKKDKDSKVFMISNTFRDSKGIISRKVFRVDEYENQGDMICDWCDWVSSVDPDVMCGHNVIGYDLPFLAHSAALYGKELLLGRDGSEAKIEDYEREFRVDGSNTWSYHNCKIYGRQLIDTMFLAVKYDFGRRYPAWGLKAIIEHEKTELFENKKKWKNGDKELYDRLSHGGNRTFYDAAKIRDNWQDPVEREKIIEYGKDDSDDALILFDIMIPSFFYYCQSIPKTMQQLNNSATGAQINSFLIRSYLQNKHSVPKANESKKVSGAISFGIPGIYKNVNKVDVASLYPSIIRTYKIYNKDKDPNANFLNMIEYFTIERLNNKRLAKETGSREFDDKAQAQKIFVNSAYGLLGAPGLHFNSFEHADEVTTRGRGILSKAVTWANGKLLKQIIDPATLRLKNQKKIWVMVETGESGKGFTVPNGDTDSIGFCTGKKITEEEFDGYIKEINDLMDPGIVWENDNTFKSFLILKTKNYVLQDYDKKKSLKIKGSATKSPKREKALKKFVNNIIDCLINNKKDQIFGLYNKLCKQVMCDSINIEDWSAKTSITDKVINATRLNEQKVLDAVTGSEFKESDKVYLYYGLNEELKLISNYNNDHNKEIYLNKIKKTLDIFENVLDVDLFTNYSKKDNKGLLNDEE